jgi:iron complex outermembrane receptor protein
MKSGLKLCLAAESSRFGLLGTTLVVALQIAHPVFAQQASGPASTGQDASQGLEEIVVTAQRKSEKLEKVPIAIAAFSGADLDKFGLKNTQDLQFTVPGLVFPQDNNTSLPYIRGVGTGFSGAGLESSIAQYVDDVYYENQQGSIQSFLDIDQIQVLKGPQGTLYGRNATGGAILITTHNPVDDFEGHITVGAGNLGEKSVEAVLNTPISDKFLVRVAGSWEDRDGYVHNNVYGNDIGGLLNYQFRAKALWRPTDDLDVLASFTYYNQYTDSLLRVLQSSAPNCVPCAIYGFKPPSGFYNTIQSQTPAGQGIGNQEVIGSLKATYHLGDDWLLTSITAYNLMQTPSTYSDQDFVPINYLTIADPGRRKERTFTEDFRAASTYDGSLNFATGVFIEKDQSFYPSGLDGQEVGPLHPEVFGNNLTWNYSMYGEAYWNISSDLKLTLGGRYNTDRRFYDSQANADSAILSGLNPATFHGDSGHKNFYDFTPRAVLNYDTGFGDVYFSWNRGFKSGGYNIPSFGTQTPVAPEKIEAFELGAKLHFFDNRLRTETSIFHYNWKNMQVAFINTETGGLFQENAAAAEASGVEQSIDAAVTDRLTIGGTFAYLHARFVSFKSAASYVPAALCPGGVGVAPGLGECTEGLDVSGTPVPNAPDYTGSLYATYRFDLPMEWSGSITALARYQGDSYFDAGAGGPLGYDQQNGYTIVNLTGVITPPDWPISIDWYIDNALDRQYATIRESSSIGNYMVPGLPRTFGGHITYNFGGGGSHAAQSEAAYVPPAVQAPQPSPRSYLVFFDFNKSDLTPQATEIVDTAAKNAGPAKVTQLTVTGHTDTVGSDAYNMRLSRRRAESVAAQLEKDGIASSEIEIVAKGKRDLLVPTADGVKEPQNRRVQIVYGSEASS